MTDHNPTAPVPSHDCARFGCAGCISLVRRGDVEERTVSHNLTAPSPSVQIHPGGINIVNPPATIITARSISGGVITTGTLTANAIREPLTVKQAAKAYKKAKRAEAAAIQAHKDAEQAERETRSAKARAINAADEARHELELAAQR